MSRTAKQFVYGAFSLALLALIIIAILPRGGEESLVSLSAPEGLRSLEVRGPVVVMTAADGSVAFLARVWNPNAAHTASAFPYSFRVMRGEAVVTETPQRTGFVYPLETTALLETVSSAAFTEDMTVALAVGAPTWDSSGFSLRPVLTLTRVETSSDGIGVFVKGEARNTGAVTAAVVRIAAIVKDAEGFPLFAAQTLLEDVPGGVSRPFFIRFPRDQGLSARAAPERIELIIEAR